MIDANASLFRHLEAYCAHRGDPVHSAGAVRYVSSTGAEKEKLKNLRLGPTVRFGERRRMTHLSLPTDDHFIALVGFENDLGIPLLEEQRIDGGTGVCLFSELRPQPLATPAAVRNIVEVSSRDEAGYTGHDYDAIASLFPSLQLWKTSEPIDDDAAWRLFFMLCIEECRYGESWIGDKLADDLLCVTDLSISSFPYRALCRSVIDLDPQALFLALYRCVEATYAYETCRKVVDSLGIGAQWHQLAEVLEDEVGWHPQEATSLNVVLNYADRSDLMEICACLGSTPTGDPQNAAGRAIYRLRNEIVHYRPGIREVRVEEIDWNELCRRLVGVVFNVFSQAYSSS